MTLSKLTSHDILPLEPSPSAARFASLSPSAADSLGPAAAADSSRHKHARTLSRLLSCRSSRNPHQACVAAFPRNLQLNPRPSSGAIHSEPDYNKPLRNHSPAPAPALHTTPTQSATNTTPAATANPDLRRAPPQRRHQPAAAALPPHHHRHRPRATAAPTPARASPTRPSRRTSPSRSPSACVRSSPPAASTSSSLAATTKRPTPRRPSLRSPSTTAPASPTTSAPPPASFSTPRPRQRRPPLHLRAHAHPGRAPIEPWLTGQAPWVTESQRLANCTQRRLQSLARPARQRLRLRPPARLPHLPRARHRARPPTPTTPIPSTTPPTSRPSPWPPPTHSSSGRTPSSAAAHRSARRRATTETTP